MSYWEFSAPGRVLPVEVDDALCGYCQTFVLDLIIFPPRSQNVWEVRGSSMIGLKLLALRAHHSTVRLLATSAVTCALCSLLLQKLRVSRFPFKCMTKYEIIVHGIQPTFSICTSKHLQEYLASSSFSGDGPKASVKFEFYRKNGIDSDWSYLKKHMFLSGRGSRDWPRLRQHRNPDSMSEEALDRAKG